MGTNEKKRNARAILEGFFGQGFKFSKPRPLKEGIFADLIAESQRLGLPFSEAELKDCVREYVYRIRYQAALINGDTRYDLNGEPCGVITEEQKKLARQQVRAAKIRSRKQASGEARKE